MSGRVSASLMLAALTALGGGCKKDLTVEVSGKGVVNVSGTEEALTCTEPLCAFSVPSGAELTLMAAPLGTGKFQAWGGDCAGEAPACTLVADDNKTARARFVKVAKVTLKVVGDGRVQSEDGRLDCPAKACEADYAEGEEVRLRRQGGTDVFDAFSGACTGKECAFVVKGAAEVTATFTVPAGSPQRGATFAPGDLDDPRVAIGFDEKGGFALVSVDKKAAHVVRFDAEGKELFKTELKVGKIDEDPAVDFFGDDLVVLTSTAAGSSVTRISPDGKNVRYSRFHKGCPSLSKLVVRNDAIFAAGQFSTSDVTCGDKELIPAGGDDGLVVRLAVEDGAFTWATQFGGKDDEEVSALAVSRTDDAWVGYNEGRHAGRLLHLNPAGKAYPAVRFGRSDETEVLDVQLVKNKLVNVMGHVFAVVDFGGASLGVAAKDGAGRAVWVQMDEEGRHQASKLVARSRCGETWLCAYDAEGGLVRLPLSSEDDDEEEVTKPKKGKKRKRGDGAIRIAVNRLGDDGAERWSTRLKGSGFLAPSAVVFGPNRSVFLVGVLEGEIGLGEKRVKAQGREAFFIQLKD